MSHVTNQDKKLSTWLPYFVFACGISYYCFAYLLRVYPSVLYEPISIELGIAAQGLGVLLSFYYFAYAPMQIPVGVTVDKFGVRRSLLGACLISVTGAFLFASATGFTLAAVGRFAIGLGSAFAYVSALKIATLWLPSRYMATAAGCATSGGMIAAILTNIFFARSLDSMGYTFTEWLPVYIGIVLWILIYFFVRDKDKGGVHDEEAHAVSYAQMYHYLKKIAGSGQVWLIGLVGAFLYLPSSVFLDVWAIPYLRDVHNCTLQQATYATSLMLGGWICSSLLTGVISDWMGNRRQPLLAASAISFVVAMILLYVPGLSYSSILVLMFVFGLGCGPHPLCFILAKENFDVVVAGTAISFTNFLIMMGGSIFQPTVGVLLNWVEPNALTSESGRVIYSIASYKYALALMPASLIASMFILLKIKETYQK